jgi:hypothetical protein
MTDDELNEIKSHLTDHTQNWDVRIAQRDRIRLLEEVDHLRECMRQAGLTAFMRGRSPQEVGDHLRSVLQSYADKITDLQERDRRVPEQTPTNWNVLLTQQEQINRQRYEGKRTPPPPGEPITENAVTGGLGRDPERQPPQPRAWED